MQATADGEFYPEKDLDKNYRIPKRPATQPGSTSFNSSSSSSNNPKYNATQAASQVALQTSSHAASHPATHVVSQTPLANAYYNYPYDPSAASAYYQNYSQYYQQYGQANINNTNFTNQEYNANNQNRNNIPSNTTASSNPNNPYNNYKGYNKNNQNQSNKTSYYEGYNNYNTNYNANLAGAARNFGQPPPPPPPPGTGMEPIKQNIYKTLKDIKEKPKNYGTNISSSNPNDSYNSYNGFNRNSQSTRTSYYEASSNPNYSYNSYKGYNKNNQSNKTYYKASSNPNNPYNNFKGYNKNNQSNETSYSEVQTTVPDLQDETLPKDLKMLFQPLYCKLCSAQLSSNQTAKMHYRSKNHEKQIRKWLIAYCEKTGEPLPKRARVSIEKQQEGADKNPTWFHCDVCDLDLTGRLHAESHYMGKAHLKATKGWKAPAGQGYYDDSGKWVRTKAQKSKPFNFENGEDNFGGEFKPDESTSGGGPPPAKKKKESQPPQKFHCDVCDINTTCQEQLENHFRGQKHMKKLKLIGLNKYSEQLIEKTGYVPPTPSIAETSQTISEKELNLSVYRTPSGDYYCPTCNITSNSDGPFIQHMQSKNHAKKGAQKKSGSN